MAVIPLLRTVVKETSYKLKHEAASASVLKRFVSGAIHHFTVGHSTWSARRRRKITAWLIWIRS